MEAEQRHYRIKPLAHHQLPDAYACDRFQTHTTRSPHWSGADLRARALRLRNPTARRSVAHPRKPTGTSLGGAVVRQPDANWRLVARDRLRLPRFPHPVSSCHPSTWTEVQASPRFRLSASPAPEESRTRIRIQRSAKQSRDALDRHVHQGFPARSRDYLQEDDKTLV